MIASEQPAYATYHDWKGWTDSSFGNCSPELFGAYSSLLAAYARHLEGSAIDFGFGNGEMLVALRHRGFEVTGIECNPTLRAAAGRHGFKVAEHLSEEHLPVAGTVAMITAFHVLEHLDKENLRLTLSRFAELLQPGGVILAAFPNGDSPFSASAFNGDVTHLTLIGSSMAEQLGILTKLKLTQYIAFPALSRYAPSAMAKIKGLLRLGAERALNGLLSRVYFGSSAMVLSPVAVAVWTKA